MLLKHGAVVVLMIETVFLQLRLCASEAVQPRLCVFGKGVDWGDRQRVCVLGLGGGAGTCSLDQSKLCGPGAVVVSCQPLTGFHACPEPQTSAAGDLCTSRSVRQTCLLAAFGRLTQQAGELGGGGKAAGEVGTAAGRTPFGDQPQVSVRTKGARQRHAACCGSAGEWC